MAETPQVEEVQQTTFDVMSEAFEELHKDDPIVEETPVEASEEVVDAEPESEVAAESDVKTPTYQEAQDAQQDTGSGDDIAEEPEASAPIHLLSEELYLRNLPSTFAVELCTSSKNSSLVSPEPLPDIP